MQTLFNKKKNLIKKNNYLVNTFFINMIVITILSMQIIPFISIEILISIIISLFIEEGLIVKKVKNNEKSINKLNIEIIKFKEQTHNQETKNDDKNLFLMKEEFNDCVEKAKKLVKVKKKN